MESHDHLLSCVMQVVSVEGGKRKVVEAGAGSRADLGSNCGCVALGCFTSLCFSITSCKMGLIIEPSSKGSHEMTDHARQAHGQELVHGRQQADGGGYHCCL